MIDKTSNHPKLRLICVGTGRDGTVSLARMIEELFERAGSGRRVAHEYGSRDFLDAFATSKERPDSASVDRARQLIEECPYDAIVGAGYAPWLPLFAKICGPELALIRLRRLDREGCIRSLADNCTFFPLSYVYYSNSPRAQTKRPAAFHYGEMSRTDWDALPLKEKLGWYFDKTHTELQVYSSLFPNNCEINTETLSSEVTLRLIGQLVLGQSISAVPTHLNAHTHLADLPPDRRNKMQWLMGRFDLRRATEDDVYALDFFTNAFIAWTGYQIHRSEHIGPEDYRKADELKVSLERAEGILTRASFLVKLLEGELEANKANLS